MHVSFVIHVLDMDLDDPAADVPCFRIPGQVIANLEIVCPSNALRRAGLLVNDRVKSMWNGEIAIRFDPEEHLSRRWHGYELYHETQRRA
jgi:hypothetical protein